MPIAHLALWVDDIEGQRAFYETYFGGRAGAKYTNAAKGFESYFLSFDDGARLEIMRRTDVTSPPPANPTLGWAHLAFSMGSVEAVDALTRRLEVDGLHRLDGPRWTGDGYYESTLLDPEGNRLEITL